MGKKIKAMKYLKDHKEKLKPINSTRYHMIYTRYLVLHYHMYLPNHCFILFKVFLKQMVLMNGPDLITMILC